jgi:nucleotide-binding universal stress UspA family protein
MKTILLPVDFSQNSRQALDFTLELNEKIKGEILLVHVLDLPLAKQGFIGLATQANMEVFYGKEAVESHQKLLEGWGTEVMNKGHFVRTELKFGNPYQNLSQLVADESADLIVMGSKGASGLKEVFIGSNAERMIRYADCPVLTIKGETHLEEIRSIVFATDGSEDMDVIASQLKEFQQLLGLKIHLVKVRTYEHQTEDQCFKDLEGFAARNDLKDFTINSYVAPFTDQGIIEFAEKLRSGLVAIGTHGRTGLAHLFAGSWAEDVANESQIPVLTFRKKKD